jgi:Mor family transcriptional regulator
MIREEIWTERTLSRDADILGRLHAGEEAVVLAKEFGLSLLTVRRIERRFHTTFARVKRDVQQKKLREMPFSDRPN